MTREAQRSLDRTVKNKSEAPETQRLLKDLDLDEPPRRVDMSLYVQLHRLANVDSKLQQFTCVFSLFFHWVDMRITEDNVSKLSDDTLETNMWRPIWYIANQLDEPTTIDEFMKFNRVRGDVIWHVELRADFEDTDFDLRDFPFEGDQLQILVRFPRHEKQHIVGVRVLTPQLPDFLCHSPHLFDCMGRMTRVSSAHTPFWRNTKLNSSNMLVHEHFPSPYSSAHVSTTWLLVVYRRV